MIKVSVSVFWDRGGKDCARERAEDPDRANRSADRDMRKQFPSTLST